ncbi:MAG: carboxypeptidase-like regulatory domain-containing protein [Polyangiales bacterium]
MNRHGLSPSLHHGTADHLMRTHLRIALAALLCLCTIPALADALVIVQVRTAGGAPADGTVEITPVSGEGGSTHRCQTQNGDCRLQAVPGGRYRVQFQPAGGGESSSRVAMIPPDGRVTLHVAAP